MNGELKKKETREVYDQKVVRLTFDVPYDSVDDELLENQDFLRWLDVHVGDEVTVKVGPFGDDNQETLD